MKISDIPNTEHYAVLVLMTHNIHHEGDERSRTNPGHGYPAYTETIQYYDYIPFDTENQMIEWIEYASNKHKHYKVIKVKPVKIEKAYKVVA